MKLAERVGRIKPSPTLAIAAKANTLKKEGRDIIGFSAGEPDFDTPLHIKDAAIKAIEEGFTKYTPVGGIDELKDAIIAKFEKDNRLDYKRSEILVSCGAKHTLYNIAQVLFERGDEVIIPAPYWVSYPAFVLLADATPVILQTEEADGFKITPEKLEGVMTEKTKAILINSPSNPAGSVYSLSELQILADVVTRSRIVVISDDIYEKIIYDGVPFVNIANVSEELKERTVVVNGVSKTYAMTGWRIGYAAGPEDIIAAASNIQSQNTSNPTSISQAAAVEALNGSQDDTTAMVVEYRKRRDFIVDSLNSIQGVTCMTPTGAFYVFPNVSQLYGRSCRGRKISSSIDLADYLLDEANIAVVPGVAFGNDDYLRISYATSMESITRGMERIAHAVMNLTK